MNPSQEAQVSFFERNYCTNQAKQEKCLQIRICVKYCQVSEGRRGHKHRRFGGETGAKALSWAAALPHTDIFRPALLTQIELFAMSLVFVW